MGKFKLTQEAREDLAEVVAFISHDNAEASVAVGDRLLDVFRLLAGNPLLGRARAELQAKLRSFPVESYLVFYRVWADHVAIVRILHGARDIDDLFD